MTVGSSILRLDRVSMKNFRCFAECEVGLHPELTVLVAENGRGKTAVLDAIGIALGPLVDALAGEGSKAHGVDRSDVQLVRRDGRSMERASMMRVGAEGEVFGRRLSWSRTVERLDVKRVRATTKDSKALVVAGKALRHRIIEEGSEQPLPLVAFYGTGRLWSEHRLTEAKRSGGSSGVGRVAGYVDCLSSSSSFKAFTAWYEHMSNAVQSTTAVALAPNERPALLIAAVRKAVKTVLEPTDWQAIDWDFPPTDEHGRPKWPAQLVVEHPDHGRLPLSVLSDGVRNMVALVGDLAHRCARLNPQLGEAAAMETPGILLIDEVDMHLHPGWQQLVVGLLQKAFPAMQMVLTTHSPHVLSTVDVKSIRVIRLHDGVGILRTPTFQTRGVESADVLAQIMGVDPVPRVEEARWLNDYKARIQQGEGESPDAMELLGKLNEHFGTQHPVMIDCERLLRFQAFKRTRTHSEGK